MSNPALNDTDWSDVVFAHGHRFAPDATRGGVTVPLHPANVKGDVLAQMMLAADFIQLEQAGAISLSLATQKMLFIGTETAQVTKLKDAATGSITRAILEQITGHADKDRVKNIVYRMIGHDVAEPYAVVVRWARSALGESGYTAEQLAPLADAVQAAMQNAERRNGALYKRLLQDVLDALRARVQDDENDN